MYNKKLTSQIGHVMLLKRRLHISAVMSSNVAEGHVNPWKDPSFRVLHSAGFEGYPLATFNHQLIPSFHEIN